MLPFLPHIIGIFANEVNLVIRQLECSRPMLNDACECNPAFTL